MEARKLLFPIALAILLVVMAAMAMVDFASFDAATRDSRPAVSHRPLPVSQLETARQAVALR